MGAQILEWSIRAALMAAGTAAALGATRIRAAAARHVAWTGLLAAMLLLPAWTSWGPRVAARVLPAAGGYPATEWTAPVDAPIAEHPAAGLGEGLASQPAPLARHWTWNREWIALGCYLLGCAAMLSRLVAGTVRARVLARRATVVDGVLASPQCAAPVTVGWFRPVVVLPADWRKWSERELDTVLTHEREHVRRRDPLVQWLALLNRCIFWFHPLAWWLERKLSELAEDACDEAVLRRGHNPHDYSECLIGLARSVERAGSRVTLCGTAIGGSRLSARIRRIMGSPAPPISSARAGMAAALCALTLAVFTACKLERAQKAAPGQPTMNELERRRAEKSREWNQKHETLIEEARKLTPEQAQNLATQVKADPQNPDKVLKLVRYYQYKVDVKGLDGLTLWFIEHRPDLPWAWNINAEWDRAGYEQGQRLWLAHLKKPGATHETYRRAAVFMEGGDKPLAERVLLEGQKRFPRENWTSPLGTHYAQVLLGSTGPVSEYNVLRRLSMKEAHGPYAQSVRAKLAASSDPQLLTQVAQWVLSWGKHFQYGKDNPLDFDIRALAKSYVDRAQSIQPDYAMAQRIKLQLDGLDKFRRLEELSKMTTARLKDVSDSDLMMLRTTEMTNAFRQSKLDDAEAKARELLNLAARNPKDPQYGDVVFEANVMLGKVALRRGSKRASVRYLLAAAETPGSDQLLAGNILMNLPRALVDWGERDAVAQFLERMAPKTIRSKEFQSWAEQIRKGINPDLIPIFSGCSQAPC